MSALENCEIISFSTDNLRVDESGAVALANRVFETFVEGELKAMTLFREILTRLMKAIVPLFGSEEHSTSNSSVFEEGDAGDKFYILLHGQVAVVKGDLTLAVLDSHAQDVHDGHPFFGEMALLGQRAADGGDPDADAVQDARAESAGFCKVPSFVQGDRLRLCRRPQPHEGVAQKQSELNVQSRTDNLNITAMSQIHTARSPEAAGARRGGGGGGRGLAEAKAGIAEAERQAAATAIQAAARGRRTRNGRRKVKALERADVGLPEQA